MIRLTETAQTFENIYDAAQAVLDYAKSGSAEQKRSATLMLYDREYILDKPLIFDAAEHPELKNIQLSISSCDSSVITSNRRLAPSRIVRQDEVCQYRLKADEGGRYPRFSDLYEGEKRLKICRSPHFTHAFALSNENDRDNAANMEGIYVPQEIADMLPDGSLYPMTITLYVEWEFFTLHVLSVDRSRTKSDEHGNTHVLLKIKENELRAYLASMNKSLQPKNRECFLSNHSVFLKKGEWCYDHTTGILQFMPEQDLKERILFPMLGSLLVFKEMDGVSLKNLRFTGVTDQYLPDNGYISMQANVIRSGWFKVREAAILTENMRGLTVENCEFTEIGANGILMCGKSARVNIHDNYFHDISMSAISIGEPIKAYIEPKNCSFDLRIDRNFFRHIGYEFPSSPAVDVFRVDGLSICSNTIEQTAYSAISVGWQWESVSFALGEGINIRDAEIAYNRITDFVQLLKDGAAIYVLGANCERSFSRRFNVMHHNFAENDRIRDTVMGYYLDGAASNWTVWDNVISKVLRPIYMQHNHYIPQQYTWHNRAYNLYCTEAVAAGNPRPQHDTLLGQVYIHPTLGELFEACPEARRIFEESGAEAAADIRQTCFR